MRNVKMESDAHHIVKAKSIDSFNAGNLQYVYCGELIARSFKGSYSLYRATRQKPTLHVLCCSLRKNKFNSLRKLGYFDFIQS